MKTTENTVLVTGGSSGIGLAIAKAFLASNNQVIICGRDPEKLAQANQIHPELHTVTCDITQSDEVNDLFGKIHDQFGGLNLLVNNAGILNRCEFVSDEDAFAKGEQEININLLGTLRVTKAALPLLLNEAESALVNISSIVALVPASNMGIYSATKAALHSFSRSLRHQLHNTPVRVFEVLPPFVDTEPVKHIKDKGKMAPDKVAEFLIKGLQTNQSEIIIGPAKALYIAQRLSPTQAERILQRRIAAASKA
jgi:uncharacterized oxidoreductase